MAAVHNISFIFSCNLLSRALPTFNTGVSNHLSSAPLGMQSNFYNSWQAEVAETSNSVTAI